MGKYSQYSLNNYMARGMKWDSNYVPKKRPRTPCPHCQKEVEASEGLKMHMKMKHKDKLIKGE